VYIRQLAMYGEQRTSLHLGGWMHIIWRSSWLCLLELEFLRQWDLACQWVGLVNLNFFGSH